MWVEAYLCSWKTRAGTSNALFDIYEIYQTEIRTLSRLRAQLVRRGHPVIVRDWLREMGAFLDAFMMYARIPGLLPVSSPRRRARRHATSSERRSTPPGISSSDIYRWVAHTFSG